MPGSISQLTQYKDLLYMIIWRDIRIKYKQSVMGFFWAIFMPMIIVSAGILVKFAFSFLSGKPFIFSDIATVAVKAIAWSFFVSSIRFSSNSLIGNTNLVTKVFFPKAIFPIASVFSQLFDFLVAACLLIIVLTVAQIGASLFLLWVPVLLILLVFFVMGLGILLSAANLFFRDVKYIVDVILTFAIFVTPVFYEVSMFGKWAYFLLLNPIAPILEGLNDCVIHHRIPQMWWILYSAIISIACLIFSINIFRKLEPAFAENI